VIAEYEQVTNFTDIGTINLNEMGNLPFYIIEHKREKIPLSGWDTLFANAEFEFVDMIESKEVKAADAVRTRARQCQLKDFENND